MRAQWNCVLCGGVLCTPTYMRRGSGACRAFLAALTTPRIVWFADGFITDYSDLAQDTIARLGKGFYEWW